MVGPLARRRVALVCLAGAVGIEPVSSRSSLNLNPCARPLQPYLNVVESFVRQTNMPDTLSARKLTARLARWVTQLKKVHSKGTNQEIEGGARLDIVRYGKDNRPNRPSRLAPRNHHRSGGLGPGPQSRLGGST